MENEDYRHIAVKPPIFELYKELCLIEKRTMCSELEVMIRDYVKNHPECNPDKHPEVWRPESRERPRNMAVGDDKDNPNVIEVSSTAREVT